MPLSGDEQLCCGDEGEVVVEAVEGSSFEVVQAESGLEFAVVVLGSPSHFGEFDECFQGSLCGQVADPVVRGCWIVHRSLGEHPGIG